MENLKLVALDPEDLSVISAHLQDAVVLSGDLVFQPRKQRFVLMARRFDWESPARKPQRRLTGLHFERVTAVRTRGIDRGAGDETLSLLALSWEPGEEPSGTLTLVFSGDKAVQLDLECIEAQMRDMGAAWAAGSRPAHDMDPA